MAGIKQQSSYPDRNANTNVDQLVVKYMEMCRVESSTDSDSEFSPIQPDSHLKGSQRIEHPTYKPTEKAIHYSMFLDPYDGSSEDSDYSHTNVSVFNRKMKQRRCERGYHLANHKQSCVYHPTAITLNKISTEGIEDYPIERKSAFTRCVSNTHMKYLSDSDLWDNELGSLSSKVNRHGYKLIEQTGSHSMEHIHLMDVEQEAGDSSSHGSRFTTTLSPRCPCSAESSCRIKFSWKRKGIFPGVETEMRPKKKLCVVRMEDEATEML